MNRFFGLDSPLFNFMEKLTNVFLLSLLWLLTSIPIITIGASTTALYYCTLKITVDRDGYIAKSYFKAFKENFKQATLIWLILVVATIILYADFFWCIKSKTEIGSALLIVFTIYAVLFSMVVIYIFPLIARCKTTLKNIFVWAIAMSIRNIHWSFLMLVITLSFVAFGFYVFWPIFFIGMGILAFLHSYVLNVIFKKYNLQLPD
jgi:uncharacterized membrane protein YesL